jgi:hypothetical protein
MNSPISKPEELKQLSLALSQFADGRKSLADIAHDLKLSPDGLASSLRKLAGELEQRQAPPSPDQDPWGQYLLRCLTRQGAEVRAAAGPEHFSIRISPGSVSPQFLKLFTDKFSQSFPNGVHLTIDEKPESPGTSKNSGKLIDATLLEVVGKKIGESLDSWAASVKLAKGAMDIPELERAYDRVRSQVQHSLALLKRMNGGVLPNDELYRLQVEFSD